MARWAVERRRRSPGLPVLIPFSSGVLEELKSVTPRLGSGRHKNKLFQRLTANKGYPKLREHLGAVVTMMQLSDDWHDFMKKLDRLRPRLDLKSIKKHHQLSFDYDSKSDPCTGL